MTRIKYRFAIGLIGIIFVVIFWVLYAPQFSTDHIIENITNTIIIDTYENHDALSGVNTLCSRLPSFSDYISKNMDNSTIDLLLKNDAIVIEEFSAMIESYISCIPWTPNDNVIEPAIKVVYDDNMNAIKSECQLYPDVFTGNLHPKGDEMFIVDLFAFAYEMDILEIRVNMLYNLVNNFVLLEDIYAQRIVKKPLFYERNKHKRFKTLDPENKIIHFIKDDTKNYNVYHKYFENKTVRQQFYDPSESDPRKVDWRNEDYFRTKGFLKYINNIYENDINLFLSQHPNSILLISDLDEVPDPNKLKLLKYCEIHEDLVNEFWNHTYGRVIESSYQYFEHNFNIFKGNRGIKSFVFRIDEDLYNKLENNYIDFGRNERGHKTVTWFDGLEKINYTGWHLSRLQTVHQLYIKFLSIAESGSWFWLTRMCDKRHNFTFVSFWDHHVVVDVDYFKTYFNISNVEECEKELLLNPYLTKIFTDNGQSPYENREGVLEWLANNTWKLPQYIKINRNRYRYYFPQFCKLKDERNMYEYECDWSSFDDFYNNDVSCWKSKQWNSC